MGYLFVIKILLLLFGKTYYTGFLAAYTIQKSIYSLKRKLIMEVS